MGSYSDNLEVTIMYNLTGVAEAEGLGGMFVAINTLTDGILFGGLILSLYVIIAITLIQRNTDFEKAFLVSGFIVLIPTLLFASVGWLNIKIVLWILILMALAGFGSYLVKRFGY